MEEEEEEIELIKDVWYYVIPHEWLYKFESKEPGRICNSQYYNHQENRFYKTGHSASNPVFWKKVRPATLEELKLRLPKNHPDLNFINTYELW